jgi:ribosome maturation protein Sdo1
MSEVNCKVNVNKSGKPQAMAFIPELKKVLPIERTRMNLRVTCSNGLD